MSVNEDAPGESLGYSIAPRLDSQIFLSIAKGATRGRLLANVVVGSLSVLPLILPLLSQ